MAQRRSPLEVRSRLLELRCRARPRLPSAKCHPAQHRSPHEVGCMIVRRRPHNPRRQRLEPLVVPPLRLGHLGAHLLCQHVDGMCRGLCPVLRAHRIALLCLEVPLRRLHVVPRVDEHCTEVGVRRGRVGPQGDGLAVDLGCSAPITLRGVPSRLSYQLRVRVARLHGVAGLPLRELALLLLPTPPSSLFFRCFLSVLWNTPCSSQAPGFAGHLTPQRYVVGSFSSRHLSQMGCFSRPSSMSDGSR
eukprot:scaffold33453_cov53-Phaeocystis_antarctica.AAC.2